MKLEVPLQAVLNLQPPLEYTKEIIDYKSLIRTLAVGMKTIIWSITHAHWPRPQQQNQQSSTLPVQPFRGLREDEVNHRLIFFLFH
uniref:Uncharacterized protein n=1 Tax=Arundo donax TaxID=35708 RepID=A0A0A9ESB8_ARUDO